MSEQAKKQKPRRTLKRIARKMKKLIKWTILLVILTVIGLFALKAYITRQAADAADATSYTRASVMSGAMSDTVYGTGTTSAKNQPNILAEADGTLTELRVSVGDTVKEGDILAVLTNTELDDTITDYEFALWELDDTILGTSAGASVVSVKAPMDGRVMAIHAQVGDDALAVFRREGALAILSTDGRMKVVLSEVAKELGLTLGDTVHIAGATVDTTGTISDLTMQGTQATVTITSDSYPMGEAVTVSTQDGRVIGEGTLAVNKPMAVSSYGGTIKAVRVKVGQKVERNDSLFSLTDSPLTLTLENLRLQREAAAKDLYDAKAQRENLIILAPCDGTIASLEVSEGDEITSGTLIGSILHGEDMNLTIAVDELDVVNVKVGQKVAITIDALSDVQMEGEVYKVAPVGTNSGGVTSYNVELSFDATGTGVRSGMNATGEIEIAQNSNTIFVPVEALMTINNQTYVMVEDGGSQTLASAANASSSDNSASPRTTRSGERSGRNQSGKGEAAQMSQASGEMPDMSRQPAQDAATAQEDAPLTAASVLSMPVNALRSAYAGLMAWLYDGVETQETLTGSLVAVTVGMQNDDYAEILSGVSAGQTVLYVGEASSSTSFGGMNMGLSMGGMGMGGMNPGSAGGRRTGY